MELRRMIASAEVARQNRLRKEALRAYKRVYYGLKTVIWPLYKESWRELNSPLQEEFLYPDGKTIDWVLYNRAVKEAFQDSLVEAGIYFPSEVMSRREIEKATDALLEFVRLHWDILPPFSEEFKSEPGKEEIREKLVQINTESLKDFKMGEYIGEEE